MKKRGSTIILFVILIVGLSLLAYPKFSNWWNSFHQSRAIMDYTETVAGLSEEEYEVLWSAAVEYNARLLERSNPFVLPERDVARYESLLNLGDNGIMGYIDIPVIKCHLPIYHGTDEGVLQTSIGHIEWTSLPVGGESTHTVLSGHRGLPSARLFTDLNRLVVGDTFKLNILDEVLTYEVDQILIVEPEDVSALQITPGMDYCTLVTCTPYGINTHRILCRGHRIANAEAGWMRVTADSVQVSKNLVALVIGVPLLAGMIGVQFAIDKRVRRDEFDDE